MARPFRFGVQLHSLPPKTWADSARRIEALGYSTIFWPDHFSPQWDPGTALTAVAAVTQTVNVGTLVYDVDYRHPVIHAKAAATLQLISGGRHEFGIGAGWMETDYRQAGMTYDRPGVRIQRLDEALQIIRSMWSEKTTTFQGEHYQVSDVPIATEPAPEPPPRILIGGGGPRILRLAGRHADIVGINPRMDEGKITPQSAADNAPERVREKIRHVHDGAASAGRDPDDIEFNTLVFVVAIADDVTGLRRGIAQNTGMTEEEVAGCSIFLTGSAAEIQDRLVKQREETGISYVVIQGDDPERVEEFAERVMKPLSR